MIPTPAVPLRTTTSTLISGPGQGSVHLLREGETLRAIAQYYGVTGEALLAANPGLDPRTGLYAGMSIDIPATRPTAPAGPRSFDAPQVPRSVEPSPPGGLAHPTAPGVRLGQAPPRTFYADPRTAALPPQPMTWPHPERPFRLNLDRPTRNPEVEIVQRALCRIGYVLRVDGHFGHATDAAVRHFQQLMGLSPNGVMTPDTWSKLRRAMEAIQQPQQVLVTARRDSFTTQDEINAYDILLALAYDEPGSNQSSDMGLRELLRVMRLPVATPLVLTPEMVTAFASRAIEVGLPLNNDALQPLDPMRLDTSSTRLNYNQARSLAEMFIRKLRGSRIDATAYDRLITRYARQYGLEPELVKAIMAIESDFNPNLTSSAGARGLMQVMPDTAAHVAMPNYSSNEDNIHAGVRYLSYLARRFNGDLVYMAAGYNSGPNRVARNNGVPPIQETYDYVRRFLSHYAYYRQQRVR